MADLLETLKSKFGVNELQISAAIGEDSSLDLSGKISSLFEVLSDPLLSVEEAVALLHVNTTIEEATRVFLELESNQILESSVKTQRPLDKSDVRLFRSKSTPFVRMKIYGIAVKLTRETSAYRFQFPLDGRIVRSIASIDRLDIISGTGVQREEIVKHVKKIAEGIEAGVQVPNSIILVFNENLVSYDDEQEKIGEYPLSQVFIRFLSEWKEQLIPGSDRLAQVVCPVEIDLPFRNAAFDDEKPCQLVDGQQRTAALSLIDVDKLENFFFSVNAIVGDTETAQATFRIANSSVKISTEFSRALLGTLDSEDGYIADDKRVSRAVKRLIISDVTSPFFKLVKTPGARNPKAPIAYNSMWSIVLCFDQSGLDFSNDATVLAEVVSKTFEIVKRSWPSAWGKNPKDSKLMHGAGLRAIATVAKDKLVSILPNYGHDFKASGVWTDLERTFSMLASRIVWAVADLNGATPVQERNFKNEILQRQNTNQDIQHLTTFLSKEVTWIEKNTKVSRVGSSV